MQDSKIWKKIRIKYCILKSLLSGPKSEKELLNQICLLPEFRPIKNSECDEGELIEGIKTSINELKTELKIKQRDILNMSTKERRIEWFLNQEWLSQTNLFKAEIIRIRVLEEKALKAKVEQDKLEKENEEREKQTKMEKTNNENVIKSTQKLSNANKTEVLADKDEKSKYDSFFNGILVLVAFGGGLYIVGKIGDSLFRIFTFPFFLITCIVGFSIYQLTKNRDK